MLLFSEHMDRRILPAVCRHACALGLEGLITLRVPVVLGFSASWRQFVSRIKQSWRAPRKLSEAIGTTLPLSHRGNEGKGKTWPSQFATRASE